MSSQNNRLTRLKKNEPVTLDHSPYAWNNSGVCKNLKCQRITITKEVVFEHPQIKEARVQLCDICRAKLLKQVFIKFDKKRISK